jgi:predicted O-methyltransferase YrrM
MSLLEAFFMYLGMALLIVQAFFAVPFLAFYLGLSFVRPDLELDPQDL